mgnify:FL=1
MNKRLWVVSWTNDQVSTTDSSNLKCFEEQDIARSYAKLMSKDYSYVNMYLSEVTDGIPR